MPTTPVSITPVLDRPHVPTPTPQHRRRRLPRRRLALIGTATVLILALVAAVAAVVLHQRWDDRGRQYLAADGWPVDGQAAVSVGGRMQRSAAQQPVPIASLAKVMTAYLVLQSLPLKGDEQGPSIRISAADVADTARRRARQESVVAVRSGERLTERQALMALLLPSANNVAVVLARYTSGTVDGFVARMNRAAGRLGMAHTRYTDPSGFDEGTVSTAADQVRLAAVVARNDTFNVMVATATYWLPVAGTVHNTDTLLGQDGFIGTKTGSDDAAGGCFMFRTYRVRHRRLVPVIGVVLGQRGHSLLNAGLYAAQQLAHRVAPQLPG